MVLSLVMCAPCSHVRVPPFHCIRYCLDWCHGFLSLSLIAMRGNAAILYACHFFVGGGRAVALYLVSPSSRPRRRCLTHASHIACFLRFVAFALLAPLSYVSLCVCVRLDHGRL